MNSTKSFTISAIRWESTYVGDFNQHSDLLHTPNMGGYKFPTPAAFHCKNIVIGLSGIDEVIYGKEIVTWKASWNVTKTLIDKAIKHWKNHIDKIRYVHVPAKSEYDEMHQYLAIPHEKMRVIPHGVNHDFFQPPSNKEKTRSMILEKYNLPQKKYFLHVGEKNWIRKNQPRIIDAYIKAKKLGLDYQLLIIGKYEDKIKKLANHTGGITFLGWIPDEDMRAFLQGSTAFILPSIHEGFGMPLVEAMSCGVPCITSNCHAPPEIISDAGILVDPYSTSEISDAMLEIANNSSLSEELSKKSIKRAQCFSWEKNANQILELYGIDTKTPMKNFENHYDLAAHRTLVTVCDLFPDEKQNFINSILQMDYSCLINWAINYGLDDSKTKDFLLPFEDWLYEKSESRNVLQ